MSEKLVDDAYKFLNRLKRERGVAAKISPATMAEFAKLKQAEAIAEFIRRVEERAKEMDAFLEIDLRQMHEEMKEQG